LDSMPTGESLHIFDDEVLVARQIVAQKLDHDVVHGWGMEDFARQSQHQDDGGDEGKNSVSSDRKGVSVHLGRSQILESGEAMEPQSLADPQSVVIAQRGADEYLRTRVQSRTYTLFRSDHGLPYGTRVPPQPRLRSGFSTSWEDSTCKYFLLKSRVPCNSALLVKQRRGLGRSPGESGLMFRRGAGQRDTGSGALNPTDRCRFKTREPLFL